MAVKLCDSESHDQRIDAVNQIRSNLQRVQRADDVFGHSSAIAGQASFAGFPMLRLQLRRIPNRAASCVTPKRSPSRQQASLPDQIRKNRQGLWFHRGITCPAMKVGTVQGGDDLEAIRNAVNGWYFGVLALGQAGHPRLAALGAPQFFAPIIGHSPRE